MISPCIQIGGDLDDAQTDRVGRLIQRRAVVEGKGHIARARGGAGGQGDGVKGRIAGDDYDILAATINA